MNLTIGDIDLVDLLSNFRGRINRGKFWLAVLIYVIVNIVVALIHFVLGALGAILAFLVMIAIFVSGIAVALKRLHDREKPGWWLAVFYIAPSVLFLIGAFSIMVSGVLATLFYLAGLGIAIWAFVELGCLPGTTGANEYGPDPLQHKALA